MRRPLATVDISVDLPAANAERTPRPDKPLFLTLKSDLTVSLDNDQINRTALASALDRATAGDKQQRVFLRADKTVPYGELMSLMNELRERRLSACRACRTRSRETVTMVVATQALPVRRGPEALRWGACFALALGFHAVGVAALCARWGEDSDLWPTRRW